MYVKEMATPIGKMLLVADDGFLCYAGFDNKDNLPWPQDILIWSDNHPVLQQAQQELESYFAGKLREFKVPCQLEGTQFQKEVWQGLKTIPYGQTKSYADLAAQIGRPKACRAVGQANHNNPLSIVVPCHRVIGKSGQLVGYGGGLDKKEWLLRHESSRAF